MKIEDLSIQDLHKVWVYSAERTTRYSRTLDAECLKWGISIEDGQLKVERFSVHDGVAEVVLPAKDLIVLMQYLMAKRIP